MKRIISVALAVFLIMGFVPFIAPAATTALAAAGEDDVKWFLIENGVLKKCAMRVNPDKTLTGRPSDIVIPSDAGITSIGDGAFFISDDPTAYSDITSVTIPNGVTSIGTRAFTGCTGLTAVTIPDSVTSIGESVFGLCKKLTSITIPSGITTIADDTFNQCEALTSITIPSGVTSIGSGAFAGCKELTSITIPDKVTSIGRYAFIDCGKLSSVTILGNPTVEDNAFANCPARFTVAYDAGGGSPIASSIVVPGVKLTSPTSANGDLVLKGWFKDQACTQAWNFDTDSVLRDTTLYAKWMEEADEPDDPDNPDDPIIPAGTVTVPSDESGIYINLTAETIELGGFTVAAYSINGGTKWIKGSLPTDAVKFSKLFDKELTLWLSDTYIERDFKEGGVLIEKKGVPDTANIVKFPKINARPKANFEKLAAYYADSTWTLMTKATKTVTATAPQSVYEYVKGNTTDGKLPDGPTWLTSQESGFGILSKPDKSDKSKNVYYFRSAASASGGIYTPRSKEFKISPAYYGAALKYKINYKTEVLKLKKDEMYSVNSGTDWVEVTEQKGILLDVSDYITSGTNIMVKKAATGAKPRTDIQTIVPVRRMVMADKEFTCANGKITDTAELKKYEILGKDSKGNDKWGSLPKITESKEFNIRLKADAKFSKNEWTGNAASAVGKLIITYDVYDESGKTPKSGITQAYITMNPDGDSADLPGDSAELPDIPYDPEAEVIVDYNIGMNNIIERQNIYWGGGLISNFDTPYVGVGTRYTSDMGLWISGINGDRFVAKGGEAVYRVTWTPLDGYTFVGADLDAIGNKIKSEFKYTKSITLTLKGGRLLIDFIYELK